MKDEYDPMVKVRHTNTNTVGLSPHYAFRSNSWDHARSQQMLMDRELAPGLVNSSLCHKQAHGQQKSSELIAIDANFMQSQSHREVRLGQHLSLLRS
ncbi:hypothetical protein M8C21_008766 [Ambrosia artemisiifolia]|uniref:Uncharacterized protein n=1 Tax=Ambrosia artemisiifolia TaxID=4212 RepID=A0AAD5DE30_AMBAR|nr:hypothetical protein M8C21_008766 [Ambrosia artemisiifolia]